MRPARELLTGAVVLGALSLPGAAQAAPQAYEYRVLHQTYGDIGIYRNVVDQIGDDTEVRSELRVAVRILGITVFRQEASRIEHWHHDRLVSFDGVTVTNGTRLPVDGEAREGGFAVTTPAGTVLAPASVHPSNPWSAMVLRSDVVMSTRSGKVFKVAVSGGEVQPITLAGADLRLHQYEIVGDKHDFVWLDDDGLPVAFRTQENGAAVDFVLDQRPTLATARLPSGNR